MSIGEAKPNANGESKAIDSSLDEIEKKKLFFEARPSVFVDTPMEEGFALGFGKYARTISELIIKSSPSFTIGIFGEWGSGKTTLLKAIKAELDEKQINTVEFNA